MGFAYGPFNGMVGFGDSGALGRDLNTFRPETAVFTAGRFSPGPRPAPLGTSRPGSSHAR